jgi:RND family efflux transporter MFP subunit
MAGGNNRSFDVFVIFDNPGAWKPGATVNGTVVLGEHANAVVIPEESVVLRPAGQVVYVVQGDKVEQRMVEVGVQQGGMVEILGGLLLGETVVVDGAGFLTDQALVNVSKSSQTLIPAAEAAAAGK